MSIASISSEMTDPEIAVMASEESGSSPAMTDSKPPAPMAPKVGDTASGNKGKVSASPAEAAPARAERRPRGESGSAGLQSRAAEFREMATDFREQAKSESGHRAENLEARADRADAAADRMESAAGRAGGGAETSASDGGDSGVAKTDRSTDGGIGNNVDAMLWDPTSPSGKSQSNYKAPGRTAPSTMPRRAVTRVSRTRAMTCSFRSEIWIPVNSP